MGLFSKKKQPKPIHNSQNDLNSRTIGGDVMAQLGKELMKTLYDPDADISSEQAARETVNAINLGGIGNPFDEFNHPMDEKDMATALGIRSKALLEELTFVFQLCKDEELLIYDWKDAIATFNYILSKDYWKYPFDNKNIKELLRKASLADAKDIAYGLKAQYPDVAKKLALVANENNLPLNNWDDIRGFLSIYVSDYVLEQCNIDKELFEYVKRCVFDVSILHNDDEIGEKAFECWKSFGSSSSDEYEIASGEDFEKHCAELLIKNGYINVELTPGSGDHGVDILAEKDSITYAIQCKYYSAPVGNSAVQEAFSGKRIYQRDIAVVMTNNTFTKQAQDDARDLGVKLWDGEYLANTLS